MKTVIERGESDLMNARSIQLLALPLVLSGCAGVVDVSQESTGDLVITPSASVYRWDGANGSLTIEAELTNRGSRDYFARVGDAFATEGSTILYVATGSDAYLERREAAGWAPVARATLIEGVSVVPLRPDITYSITAFVTDRETRGDFRLRVEYALDADGTWAGESVSTMFEIR